jgi:hypothetical protein
VRSSLRFPVLGALILALSPAAFSTEPDTGSTAPRADETIAAIVEAYGGEELLRSIRGCHAKGVQLAVRTHAIVRTERWFARPDRVRLELAYPDRHETRYTEGARGWVGSSTQDLRLTTPMRLQAMRMHAARSDLPLRLLEHPENVVLREPDEDDRMILRLQIETGLFIHCHVNRETFRIERVSTWIPGPPPVRLSVAYEKFRVIDGALTAFAEVTYMGDRMASRFETLEFEWNPVGLDAAMQQAAAGTTL